MKGREDFRGRKVQVKSIKDKLNLNYDGKVEFTMPLHDTLSAAECRYIAADAFQVQESAIYMRGYAEGLQYECICKIKALRELKTTLEYLKTPPEYENRDNYLAGVQDSIDLLNALITEMSDEANIMEQHISKPERQDCSQHPVAWFHESEGEL